VIGNWRPRFRAWRHRYLAVALFGTAVALLVALSTWWFVLIHGRIVYTHELHLALLDTEAQLAAERMGDHLYHMPLGLLPDDRRFEIGVSRDGKRFLRPAPRTLARIEASFERRKGMVIGEGTLLTSLLVAVVAMLYHLVRTERRFRSEMEEFLGRVTHEMKTPLAGIRAVLESLQGGRIAADQQPTLVALALEQIEREQHLVQNLLLAQRMRRPDQRLNAEDVPLATLLARFADHRRQTLTDGAGLDLACPPELHAHADATAVWTILENLADNALKYGARTLKLTAVPHHKHVRVALQDDGIGFDPALHDHIFQPFVRAHASHTGQGTGLGLHLSRALAERMGGRLRAHSDGPGKGARFELELPAIHNP
jgi:signal transduction histidine kinase